MHPWLYILLALSSLVFSLSTITTALAADITKPPILGPITKGPSLKAVGTTTPTPYGGIEAKGWVMLSTPASTAIHVVLVPSNSQLVEYPFPQGVQLSVGQTVGNFTFQPKPVTAPTQLVVTARIGTQEAKTINYTILPPVLVSMSLNATSVLGGTAVQGTTTFSGPPAVAGAIWAKLSSSNPAAATVPAKAMLEVGKIVTSFEVKTLGVANDTPVTIFASTGSTYPTTGALNPYATLKVLPATLADFGIVANGSLFYGSIQHNVECHSLCSLGLAAPTTAWLPSGANILYLSSSNPTVLPIPATVTLPLQPSGWNWIGWFATPTVVASNTRVDISASFRGVTKKVSALVKPPIKPDLVIKTVSLKDRFGQPITKPQDSLPFNLCITVGRFPSGDSPPTVPTPASLLRVEYRSPGTGGVSVGRAFDITVDFSTPGGGQSTNVTPCAELPGLAVGSYYDVTLQADVKNQVDERNEGNNSYGPVRISR